MDPALFRIDWDVLAELLATVIVLSFFVERSLSLLFEHRFYITRFHEKGLKTPIALFFSFIVVASWDFDALSILFKSEENAFIGYLITAAIVSGGSKASIKLFHDIMGVKSKVLQARDAENNPNG